MGNEEKGEKLPDKAGINLILHTDCIFVSCRFEVSSIKK